MNDYDPRGGNFLYEIDEVPTKVPPLLLWSAVTSFACLLAYLVML